MEDHDVDDLVDVQPADVHGNHDLVVFWTMIFFCLMITLSMMFLSTMSLSMMMSLLLTLIFFFRMMLSLIFLTWLSMMLMTI